MTWPQIMMPVPICKPSLEASSIWWPRFGITPWPKESDFRRVISQANGLFIFIKTLVFALKGCEDPEEGLKAALQESSRTGLESLYALYSSILKSQIVHIN